MSVRARMYRRILLATPVVALAFVFAWVVATPTFELHLGIPHEPMKLEQCTWFCHNHGCPHRAVLPAFLTSDAGLFGATIRALGTIGARLSSDRSIGYGLANLLIYCVLWPAVTFALYRIVVAQHLALREARARLRVRSSKGDA